MHSLEHLSRAQHPRMLSSPDPQRWLQRADTIAAFVSAPTGKYVASNSFVFFQTPNRLSGFALWGSPGTADMRALLHVMMSTHGATPHASFVDGRGLVCLDAAAFDLFAEGVAARYRHMAISKQAILRPAGVIGATVAGFYDLLPPPFDAEVFADSEPALDWLGTIVLSLASCSTSSNESAASTLCWHDCSVSWTPSAAIRCI